MTLHLHVLVDRGGRVFLGPSEVDGMLCCGPWPAQPLVAALNVLSRHGYDGAWLVPGVPEAKHDDDACDAVIEFRNLLEQRRGRRAAP